jgi:peptide chain release factor subunit 1
LQKFVFYFCFIEEKLLYLNKDQEKDASLFHENGVELEVIDKTSLLEFFANNYKKFGATLEFVTNRSQEGSQFVKGFGGIGGLLRYRVDFNLLEEQEDFGNDDDLEDYF